MPRPGKRAVRRTGRRGGDAPAGPAPGVDPAPPLTRTPFSPRPLGTVGVVGLGHVGVPLAALIARKYAVVGVDINPRVVELISAGKSPLRGREFGLDEMLDEAVRKGRLRARGDYESLKGANTILVCVDTPLRADHTPDSGRIEAAADGIGKNLSRGALVILESTVAPGTSSGIIIPRIEKWSGLGCGEGFHYAHAPERVMPGRLLRNLESYARVVGGSDAESTERAVGFYRTLLDVDLHPTDMLTAEIAKTAENSYRDVQIAFANEVALICEELGADVYEVRRLVNTCPFRDMHLPGAGVGGHCLPKEGWLLVANAAQKDGVAVKARAVNDSMPAALARRAERVLKKERTGFLPRELRVTVLGASYLGDSGDTRNSPALELARILKERGFAVRVHDPFAEEPGVERDLDACVEGSDCLIVATSHSAYRKLDLAKLGKKMRTLVIVDGRAAIERSKAEAAGFVYKRLGVGEPGS